MGVALIFAALYGMFMITFLMKLEEDFKKAILSGPKWLHLVLAGLFMFLAAYNSVK